MHVADFEGQISVLEKPSHVTINHPLNTNLFANVVQGDSPTKLRNREYVQVDPCLCALAYPRGRLTLEKPDA